MHSNKKNPEAEGVPSGVPIMKVDGPTYLHQYAAFAYEKGSSFAEIFYKTMQQIIESGLIKICRDKEKIKIYSSVKTSISVSTEDTLFQYLIVIL